MASYNDSCSEGLLLLLFVRGDGFFNSNPFTILCFKSTFKFFFGREEIVFNFGDCLIYSKNELFKVETE
jgi:hypothetical protein